MDIIRGIFSGATSPAPTITNTAPAAPDRGGTFIVPDIYPADLGQNPPFHALPGLHVMGSEVIGCYVKCSEGVGWGQTNEEWFERAWKSLRDVGGERYGKDWFRGCYHFLRFDQDGARQADYLCDLVDRAGGWGPGDLCPWVDVEEGGQGKWAGGERLEDIRDPAKRRRLALEVRKCVTDFVSRFKQRTGLRIMVYGRGIFRDLGMSDCRFGADGICNPAYTATMPRMDAFGWPIEDIQFWQACGDGEVHVPGFPSSIPGWGRTDYSIYINGSAPTTLTDFRKRCLTRHA